MNCWLSPVQPNMASRGDLERQGEHRGWRPFESLSKVPLSLGLGLRGVLKQVPLKKLTTVLDSVALLQMSQVLFAQLSPYASSL